MPLPEPIITLLAHFQAAFTSPTWQKAVRQDAVPNFVEWYIAEKPGSQAWIEFSAFSLYIVTQHSAWHLSNRKHKEWLLYLARQ